MAQPSEETKKSAASMAFSRLSKTALASAKKTISTVGKLFTKKPENLVDATSPPVKIMGEIYKMMKLMDLDRKLNQEMVNAHIEEQNHIRDKRNKELIKALTVPKIKKIRAPKPQVIKTQETQPTITGTPPKTTPPTNTPPTPPKTTQPTPPTNTPPTPPKTTQPAPPKTTEPPKTTQPAPPKTTEPPKPVEPPKTNEPPKTATPVKPPETPPKPVEPPPKVTQPAPAPAPPPAPAPAPAPSSTAAKVGAGVAIAGASSISLANEIGNKIATHESAGKSEKSYEIMNFAGTDTEGKKDTEWDKYKLTDMTIEEVLDLAEKRRLRFNEKDEKGKVKKDANGFLLSKGVAAGKYQFVPDTLKSLAFQVFGKEYLKEKFSADNQERLHDKLFGNEIRTLQALGVPISEATLYMSHFLGPSGAAKVYKAKDDVKMSELMSDAQQKANPTIAKLTVGEYKERITTSDAKSKREALSKEIIDKKRLEDFLQTAQNTNGNKIELASKQGNDLAKEINAQQRRAQTQQTVNILSQAKTEEKVDLTKPNDTNILLEKVRAG